jgi:hypothetical protein
VGSKLTGIRRTRDGAATGIENIGWLASIGDPTPGERLAERGEEPGEGPERKERGRASDRRGSR